MVVLGVRSSISVESCGEGLFFRRAAPPILVSWILGFGGNWVEFWYFFGVSILVVVFDSISSFFFSSFCVVSLW